MEKKNIIKMETIKVGDHVFYNAEDKNLFGKDFIVIHKERFIAEIIESDVNGTPSKIFKVPLSDLYRKNAFSISDKIPFCNMEGTITKISFDKITNQFYYQISLPMSAENNSRVPESFLLKGEDIDSDYNRNAKNENYKSKDVVRIKSFKEMRKEYPLKRFGIEIPCPNTPTKTLTFTHDMIPFAEKAIQLEYHPYCEGTFSIRNLDLTISLKNYPWAFTDGMFKKRLNEFRCKDYVLFYSKHNFYNNLDNKKRYLVTHIRDILYKNGIIEYLIGIVTEDKNQLLFWVTSKDIMKYTVYSDSIRNFLKEYRNDPEENYIIDIDFSTAEDKIKGNIYLENDKYCEENSHADLIGKFEVITNQHKDTIINIYNYCYHNNTFTLIGRGETKYNPEDGYSRDIGLSIAGKKIKKVVKKTGDTSVGDKTLQIIDYIKNLPIISSDPKFSYLFLNCYKSLITSYRCSTQQIERMTDTYKTMLLEIENILSNISKTMVSLLQQIQEDLEIDAAENEINDSKSLTEYLKKIMR